MLSARVKKTCHILAGGIALISSAALAQSSAETLTARDLLRLKQVELIQSSIEKNKGQPAENLFRAQLALATWDKLPNSRSARAQATVEYVGALEAYLKNTGAQVDGQWALDHVKFIAGTLAEPVVSRMEYWGICLHDRQELAPLVDLLSKLRGLASDQINAATEAAEKRLAGDPRAEKEYMSLYTVQQECDYYHAQSGYIMALASGDTATRKTILADTITQLGRWADAAPDEQPETVRFSALLMRAKSQCFAGGMARAQKDLETAGDARAPVWVQYQAHYHMATPAILNGDWGTARKEAEKFKNWVESTPAIASVQTRVAADLLMYRVLGGAIQAQFAGVREQALAKLEETLRSILRRQPQMKDMVLECVATQIGDSRECVTDLENLAYAWGVLIRPQLWVDEESQQKNVRAALACAQKAAASTSKAQTALENIEASLLVAVACGKLGQWLPAAKANIEFAEKFPGDARAPDAARLALAQLTEFRKAAENSPEVQQLTLRALAVAIEKLGQKNLLFAKGLALEEMKQRAQAAQIYGSIARNDEHYLDARYRLLRIAVEELADLQAAHAQEDKQKLAAKSLINYCADYLAEVEKLPPSAPQRKYIPDIWLIETGVNLEPLGQPAAALKRLGDLESRAGELPPATVGAILRCKVQAYQMAGNAGKAADAVKDFAARFPQEAPEFIRQMVAQQTQEIARLEKTDQDKAGQLAAGVAGLLDPLTAVSQADEAKKKDAYTYRQLKADMLARGGRGAESQQLWNQLQLERPADLYNFLGEARAMFVTRQYDLARDLFSRILPKVPVGSESYWECYLRIVQSDELRGKPVDAKRLKDLKVVYGDAVGGREFKNEFAALLKKYGE